MKKVIFLTFLMSAMVACEQQDVVCEDTENNALKVEAEIAASTLDYSRTSTTAKTVEFTQGDKIGFYMPEAENSNSWTYSSGTWTATSDCVWPDKTNSYDFCAYYPFSQTAPRTEIPMPDLTTQEGGVDNLGKYDFLVARCTASYSTGDGVVSFTKDQAFKHVYALISVTLKTNTDTEGSHLTDLQLNSTNLLTSYTYHFGESAEEDGVTLKGKGVDELLLQNLDVLIPSEGQNYVFVVNPLNLSLTMNLTVKYQRDGKKYTASAKIPTESVVKGSLNKLTISIKKSGLVIEGNTVEDWVEQNMKDVVLEENPDSTPGE